MQLQPGSVLAGKYRIERQLGEGGMGVVLAAQHTQLEQRVAIKVLRPAALSSPEAVARFLGEARAAARLRSEHAVRVFDVGTLDSGEPYMVMEHLEGEDLASRVARSGPMPWQQALDAVLQACEAVAEAHSLGIIHRDLKPGNLFLVQRPDGSGRIKVLDFGISKMSGAESSGGAVTRTGTLMGSPLYMSPEQMRSSKQVDARSDIWSIGALFYELLSGSPPFEGESLPQVCTRVLEGQMEPLERRVPGVPPLLSQAIQRCLEKDPERRFPDLADFARALAPLATGHGAECIAHITAVLRKTSSELASTSAARRSPDAVNPIGATEMAWGDTRRTVSSSRRWPWVAAGGALLVGALVAISWPRGGNSDTTAATPSETAAATAPAPTPEALEAAPRTSVVPGTALLPAPASAAPSAAGSDAPEAPAPSAEAEPGPRAQPGAPAERKVSRPARTAPASQPAGPSAAPRPAAVEAKPRAPARSELGGRL